MEMLDAWLTVIARDGWAAARLDAVAAAAGQPPAAVAAVLPDRWTALRAFDRALAVAALAEASTPAETSVRDRLFGIVMAHFDAAQSHRNTIRTLVDAARRDPGLAAFGIATLSVTVARLVDAAGVVTTGWLGPLRAQALTLLYLQVARAWLADESADLGATMKALDTALANAERWAKRLPDRSATATAALPAAPDAAVG